MEKDFSKVVLDADLYGSIGKAKDVVGKTLQEVEYGRTLIENNDEDSEGVTYSMSELLDTLAKITKDINDEELTWDTIISFKDCVMGGYDYHICDQEEIEMYNNFIKEQEENELPQSVSIPFDDLKLDESIEEDFNDAINEYLSDTYGFCTKCYCTDNEIKVSDIEWDTEE